MNFEVNHFDICETNLKIKIWVSMLSNGKKALRSTVGYFKGKCLNKGIQGWASFTGAAHNQYN